MSPRYRPFVLLTAALAGGTLVFAARTPVPGSRTAGAPAPARNSSSLVPTATFDAFRSVVDRNIFNSLRTGKATRGTGGEATAPVGDTITLVGTMDSEKGTYAFFDSPQARYRQARREGQSLPPFTVTHVRADAVELAREGTPVTLSVGQQLRHPPGGNWTIVSSDVVQAARMTESAAASGIPDLSTPPPIPADASETLRRLMEQRQKQLKQ